MNNALTSKKTGPAKIGVLVVVLAALVTLPAWGGASLIPVFTLIMLYMAVGQMWNLLAGYAGLVSLGQHCFIGLGGYAIAVITEKFKLPLVLGFVVAAVVSVLFALLISIPIFKMRGVYFTIGTWVVAEVLALFFGTWAFVNYGTGYNISVTYHMAPSTIYFIALIVGVFSVALVFFLLRSRFGLGLMAMRDNESAAEVRGVPLYKTKLQCFLISSCVTSIAGAVMYMNIAYILPSAAFGMDWTVSMVFIVIIGGIGTVEGPIIGAVVYVLLRQWLYDFPGYSMIILGAIAIAIILIAPKGIMGLIDRLTGFEFFSARRRAAKYRVHE